MRITCKAIEFVCWNMVSGHNIEITEFGVFEEENRRKGWGTQLLEAAFEDMRQYFVKINHPLWKIYLFCEERNERKPLWSDQFVWWNS